MQSCLLSSAHRPRMFRTGWLLDSSDMALSGVNIGPSIPPFAHSPVALRMSASREAAEGCGVGFASGTKSNPAVLCTGDKMDGISPHYCGLPEPRHETVARCC